MSSGAAEPKVDQLTRYIAASRRVQRNLKLGLVGGVVVGLALWPVHSLVGLGVLFSAAFTAGVGYYITGVRIHDWKQELYELERGR